MELGSPFLISALFCIFTIFTIFNVLKFKVKLKISFKKHIARILLNHFVIALPLALITIFLLPIKFQKFALQMVEICTSEKPGQQTIQYYHDLDADGYDEEISHFVNKIDQCAIKIRDAEKTNMGQWNFNGILANQSRNLLFVDLDKDSIQDIFTIYQREDSVFLGGINPQIINGKIIEDLFLDKIKTVNNTTDFNSNLYSHDLNNDGTDELVIIIAAGYSEQPRRLYAYDFITKTLKKSAVFGFFPTNLLFTDLDADGDTEILSTNISYENIEKHLGIPYNDYERWFAIFDHNLEFEYEPVNMGYGYGRVTPFIFDTELMPKMLLSVVNNKSNLPYSFFTFDANSSEPTRLITEFENMKELSIFKFSELEKSLLAITNRETGELWLLNPEDDFNVYKNSKIHPNLNEPIILDIMGDKKTEYIFKSHKDNKDFLVIYTHDLSDYFEFIIPEKYKIINNITTRTTPNNNKYLILQLNDDIVQLNPSIDHLYLLKNISLYAIIFGVYSLFIWFIMHMQKKILHVNYQNKQTIAELKLKTIRNQLDPHFIFNAINAIAAAILKKDKETAYNYFSLFSKLLRSTMLYSDRMSRSLKDELDFTIQYLKIEKFRYRDKFEYSITVDENINVIQEVPGMIIQTFAETAITNGLMHRKTEGKLQIQIRKEKNELLATFKDNGVGIKTSEKLNKERAFKSLKIMDEFIDIFNNLNKTKITYEMVDLNENEEFPGTLVTVKIPYVKKYL